MKAVFSSNLYCLIRFLKTIIILHTTQVPGQLEHRRLWRRGCCPRQSDPWGFLLLPLDEGRRTQHQGLAGHQRQRPGEGGGDPHRLRRMGQEGPGKNRPQRHRRQDW